MILRRCECVLNFRVNRNFPHQQYLTGITWTSESFSEIISIFKQNILNLLGLSQTLFFICRRILLPTALFRVLRSKIKPPEQI